jgi:ABC-type branched-subunit amino acid transport system ATPase component
VPISSVDPENEPRLIVRELTAGYGGTPIVNEVSVIVREREIVTIVGANGSGKSTLLKAIMGIIGSSNGSVMLGDRELLGLRTDQIAALGVGYVPQVRDVFDPLDVRENLEMGAYLLSRKLVSSRVKEIFELFPALAPLQSRRAGNLSGGERKLLAIGRVLMNRPDVLILDEPTANLSPQVAHNFLRQHISRLAESGCAILLVEQHAVDALAVATFAHVMVAGQVQVSGPAAEIIDRQDIGDLLLGFASRD